LPSVDAIVPAFFYKIKYNKKLPTLEETYLYLLREGYFHFQTGFGTGFFPLTFPWTGWFTNYRFWDGLQFFLPFN